jgi:fatty acid desaturase
VAEAAATTGHLSPGHEARSRRLIGETVAVFLTLALLAAASATLLSGAPRLAAVALLAIPQGMWLDRMYTVAHEAVHFKLFPGRTRLNDAVATLLLAPIAAPLSVYRRIHGFHHGGNRRDRATAALDQFRTQGPPSPAMRRMYGLLWNFYVFGGGFFLHSLLTILIFLVVPARRAARISPVFRNWPARMRLRAWAEFGVGAALHAAVIGFAGWTIWLAMLGLPLLVFAWLWSMLLYIYHYRTSIGPDVRRNVRSLPRQPFFSWLLLNFNEHATHHRDPTIPWYALPDHRDPADVPGAEDVRSLGAAIRQQRAGPTLWSPE